MNHTDHAARCQVVSPGPGASAPGPPGPLLLLGVGTCRRDDAGGFPGSPLTRFHPSGLRAYTERGPAPSLGLPSPSTHRPGLEDIRSSGPGLFSSPGNGGASSGPSGLGSGLLSAVKGGVQPRIPGSRRVPKRAPGAGSGSYYPEYLAKGRFSPGKKALRGPEKEPKKGPKMAKCVRCGAWALVRACEDQHTFGKTIDCGREWCEKCRASSHSRRLARWLPKAQKLGEIGYFVLTFPFEDRPRTAEKCREIGEKVYRFLKRRGFSRGLRRWHWFGEKPGVWNPHLNLLVGGGWIEKEKLLEFREELGAILGSRINLNYQYCQSVGKIFHKLKYITRATWKDASWAPELKDEFFNFRNTWSWGKWEDDDKWALPESEKGLANVRKIGAGICPTCGKKLLKGRICKVEDLDSSPGWEKIWEGVWQHKGPPENVLLYRLFQDFKGALEKGGRGGEL